MTSQHADKIEMQNRLFSQLSAMFGREVPLYDKSLLVNTVTNRAVCDLLAKIHIGFSISDAQLDQTSGERHGAIRIGTPEEYRWVARFFACFAMEPHNFYDMSGIGAKSQPIVATAFRSVIRPEHRVFTSLLLVESFDDATRDRIKDALATRRVFSDRAKELIESSELRGGLSHDDADALIREGTDRIFKWTGTAREHDLYLDLCNAGFKIAADIACFDSHHLNHLTPNTFCIDLYTAAMRFCMGVAGEAAFREHANAAIISLLRDADAHSMALQFKHLTSDEIASYKPGKVNAGEIAGAINALVGRLTRPDLQLSKLKHSGFKDSTEGPPNGVPVLLRQDAYKALTEPVTFRNRDATTIETVHTARFGEIEQRFYATTPEGRALYDECLRDADAGTLPRDEAFARFPGSLDELLQQGKVFGLYQASEKGLAAARSGAPIETTDIHALVRRGFVHAEGLRYEDFLPFSAAGIFASNLDQYGTDTMNASKPAYTEQELEEIMGRKIVDPNTVYAGLEAQSLLETYEALRLSGRIGDESRRALEAKASACQAILQAGCAV